ncbi:mitogen-activated protein kinase kinase kinase 6-like [Numida meleagris]|uniref:mitogen-activated protein kinase kinase kinase 6-like n=1 Tax=Numida meleagris TaxID=8996 RepID=UPI000B3DE555|nr:mitogen-activated protein kinase kinase kinase 6-like [Numida meleagris]XP_021231209.1 mitogen-activated protein kinase kinase kinase 6-like [Numida meleagris]XP_021231210.1 mitogen-activated protein kinase kinase kinase 6-like [Numida meleagris]
MVQLLGLSGCRFQRSASPRTSPTPQPMAAPRAGSCWQDPLAVAGSPCRPVCGTRRRRALSVVCVPSCPAASCPALRCLRDACHQLRGRLHTVPFGRLALGDTAALERFYNADVAVVELSDAVCQPSLFYHLGVRESSDMPHNVLLCCRAALPALRALQVSGDGHGRSWLSSTQGSGGEGHRGWTARCYRHPSPP